MDPLERAPEAPARDAEGGRMPAHVRRKRQIFFGFWGALLLGILSLFRGVLLPFFLAIVVAYVLAPVVARVEGVRVLGRRMPRWAAVVAVYAALIGVTSVMAIVGAPRLGAEIQKLARELPETVTQARDRWIPEIEAGLRGSMAAYDDASAQPESVTMEPEIAPEVIEGIRVVPLGAEGADGYEVRLPPGGLVITPEGERYTINQGSRVEAVEEDFASTVIHAFRGLSKNTEQHAATVLHTAQTVVGAVVKGVFTFFIMLMLSAYLLITRESVLGFSRSLVWPRRRARFEQLLERIDRGLSGVVRGQLLICLVNGLLSGIGFYLFDLRYWPILTLVATVFSIIPIFGAILSSVPAVVIGLEQGLGTALMVLAWILLIHQIEANLLNPKIMGDAAQVHPVLVVFALLAGEHLFGIAGALLAVPVLSITQSLFLHYRESALGVTDLRGRTDAAPVTVAEGQPITEGSATAT